MGEGRRPGTERDQGRPRPLRRYGQNHLVDRNVLRAIVDQAGVGPEDVVLEVGPAGGSLTRPLLERAGLVHAVEVDRRYLARLERLAATEPRLRVQAGDVLRLDLSELDPPPTALVANLPYNVAIPLIMTTIATLPSVLRWGVMVQRELGERLFAVPRQKAYAAVSVLAQLACLPEHSRPVPREAFRPRPNVESVFLTFARRPAGPDGSWLVGGERLDREEYAAMSKLVRQAFAQRRKQLGGTLGGAGWSRSQVREALAVAGLPQVARPEELAPPDWVRFARVLGALPGTGTSSPAIEETSSSPGGSPPRPHPSREGTP